MPRYRRVNNQWLDEDGAPVTLPNHPIGPRTVVPDLPDYISPVTGKLVSGRVQRRYDLESNNCVDARDFPSPTGGRFRNKRFVEKHGLELSEEYR